MSRYINANKKLTITVYDDEHEEIIDHYITIEEILDTYTSEGCPPTADVVKVVRCKDCKYKPYRDEDGFIEPESGRCPCINDDDYYYSWIPEDDWFCGWGERREDDKG